MSTNAAPQLCVTVKLRTVINLFYQHVVDKQRL